MHVTYAVGNGMRRLFFRQSAGRILWLEDALSNFAPTVEALQARGVEVSIAASALEAHEIIAVLKPFDLYVIDSAVPDGRSRSLVGSLAPIGVGFDFAWYLLKAAKHKTRPEQILVLTFFPPIGEELAAVNAELEGICIQDKDGLGPSAMAKKIDDALVRARRPAEDGDTIP